MAANSYGAAKELADKIESDGLCCLCDYGENYRGHGEVKVVPFPFDVDRDLIVKALRAYGSHGPNDAQDAARYRFLRREAFPGGGDPFICRHANGVFSRWTIEHADAAIDAAMNSIPATHLPDAPHK